LAVGFQAREPLPSVSADGFEIGKSTVPAIETNMARCKATSFGRRLLANSGGHAKYGGMKSAVAGAGKQAEAHQMLAEIYGWFTEGFQTMDLREAKALLEAFCT
jgi:hypothetical protein